MTAHGAENKMWERALVWPVRHPVATLTLTILAVILAILGTRRIHPDASLDAMFSKDDPAARALLRVLNHFSAAEEMLLLVSLQPDSSRQPPDVGRLLGFAQRLEEAVRRSAETAGLCDNVIYRADPDTRSFIEQVLAPAGLLYLSDAQFAAAGQRLTLQGMREQVAHNEAMIAAPGPAAQAIAKATLQDPLRLHEFLLSHLASQRPFRTYQNQDALVCADGRSLLIRIAGRRPPSDLDFAKQFTAAVAAVVDRVNIDHLSVEYSGAYAIAAASERAIRHDMISSISSSVICLQLLFVLAYRRPLRLMALAFAPVAVGVLWGFGAYSLVGASLTPLTAVIGAILAGLAIDYSIHLLTHYESERLAGHGPRQAAEQTLRTMAPALLAAWLTSVIGFLAIGSSRVPAIRDFAMVGSLGLAGACLAAVTFVPALLVLLDRRSGEQVRRRTQARFGIGGVLRAISHHRWLSLAGSAALLVVSIAILATSAEGILPLESDLAVMHPRPSLPLEAQAHIAERFGTSMDWLILHQQAASPEDLVSLAHRTQERLAEQSQNPHSPISGTLGLASVLPDPQQAAARLAAIPPGEAERVAARYRSVIADSPFDPAACEPYAQFLQHLVGQRTVPGLRDLLAYPGLARSLLPRMAPGEAAPPTEAITLLFLRQPLQSQADRDAAVERHPRPPSGICPA